MYQPTENLAAEIEPHKYSDLRDLDLGKIFCFFPRLSFKNVLYRVGITIIIHFWIRYSVYVIYIFKMIEFLLFFNLHPNPHR